MADSYTTVAAILEQAIATEFAAEHIVARHDKLHESMGLDAVEVAIYPLFKQPGSRNKAIMETFVMVQFFGIYEKMVDPTQQVDPRLITQWADRFERKVESVQGSASGSNEVWFFEVVRTDFPDDPTGNKTRFQTTIKATGDNTALIQRMS